MTMRWGGITRMMESSLRPSSELTHARHGQMGGEAGSGRGLRGGRGGALSSLGHRDINNSLMS
jgi:hypothetical protein